MRVVAAHEHGAGKRAQMLLGRAAERRARAGERVGEQRGQRPLLGARAHLLVVEARVDAHVARVIRREEGLERHIGALEVVEMACGDELASAAPDARLLVGHEEEVAREDVRRLAARGLGHHLVEGPRGKLARREERAEVHRAVELGREAARAVEVDGEARDEADVVGDVHETALHARAVAHEHAARKSERAVQPRVVEHASVGLDVEAEIPLRPLERGRRLHLVGGRVAVGGGQLEVVAALGGARPRPSTPRRSSCCGRCSSARPPPWPTPRPREGRRTRRRRGGARMAATVWNTLGHARTNSTSPAATSFSLIGLLRSAVMRPSSLALLGAAGASRRTPSRVRTPRLPTHALPGTYTPPPDAYAI